MGDGGGEAGRLSARGYPPRRRSRRPRRRPAAKRGALVRARSRPAHGGFSRLAEPFARPLPGEAAQQGNREEGRQAGEHDAERACGEREPGERYARDREGRKPDGQATGGLLALEDERRREDRVGEERHDDDAERAHRHGDRLVDDEAKRQADEDEDRDGVAEEESDPGRHATAPFDPAGGRSPVSGRSPVGRGRSHVSRPGHPLILPPFRGTTSLGPARSRRAYTSRARGRPSDRPGE